MKRITLQRPATQPDEPLYLDTLREDIPIFAKARNRIKGMVLQEKEGWILRTGGSKWVCGHHPDRASLLGQLEARYGLTLHVEEEGDFTLHVEED